MNDISHKQAIRLIHRHLDGLLSQRQRLLLEEHLQSCDTCRPYATEMDLLPTRLQNEFHIRWDREQGPSQKIMEQVTAKARNIPMKNRFSSAVRLFAGVLMLITVAFAIDLFIAQSHNISPEIGTLNNALQSKDRLIAFASEKSGNFDIYTIRTDGSKLTNLTNNPSKDLSPLWSPDGKRIAFTSERTGNTDIFVMNSDGGNLIQLTDNPGYDGFFSWSPHGQKIVYLSSAINYPYVAKLMVMNADGSNQTVLTQETGSYNFLGWSPDGQKIIYRNAKDNRIYVKSITDRDHHEGLISNNDQIHWENSEYFLESSWNGVSEQPQWVLHRFNINGELPLQPVEVASHTSPIVAIFGTTYIVEGGTTLAWYSTNKNAIPLATWNLKTKCKNSGDQFLQETTHRISPDGTHAFVTVSCFGGPTSFYFENADGSEVKQLTNFSVAEPSQILDRAWSPDGKYVILTIANSSDKADIYLFDIEKMLIDPLTRPVQLTTDGGTKYGAIWQPIP